MSRALSRLLPPYSMLLDALPVLGPLFHFLEIAVVREQRRVRQSLTLRSMKQLGDVHSNAL
jgi:hypothetical protein